MDRASNQLQMRKPPLKIIVKFSCAMLTEQEVTFCAKVIPLIFLNVFLLVCFGNLELCVIDSI